MTKGEGDEPIQEVPKFKLPEGLVLLVVANKQDCAVKEGKKRPGILDKRTEEQMRPMKAPEVTKVLDLHSLKGIPWFV